VIGLLGGAFDPPHNGHVALARAALERFELERLVVLVVERPGHKEVALPFEDRLRLARLAFAEVPRTEVEGESAAYTVDSLRDGRFDGAVFLVGGDEFADFPGWKEPDEILRHVTLGVATRPGFARVALEPALARLEHAERVEFFEVEPVPVSSSAVRERARVGESLDGMVPASVAREIEVAGLYR
jgi:nicotinate-nucleotide adenylyltransferase